MTLQLRWRNPRTTSTSIESWETPDFVNPYDMVNLDVLIATYRLTIPNRERDNWRWVFPNTGYLQGFEHFGSVMIHATNGLLAYYRVDESGSLWLGHLAAFVGPVAKEYVWEDDWDWETHTNTGKPNPRFNKRKVNVFKRADGSIVVIPKDTFWDRYWTKNQRWSKEELAVWAEVGHGISIHEVDEHLARLTVKTFTGERKVNRKPHEKSARQKLLETI